MSPQLLEELRLFLQRNGAAAKVTHPTTTLEELFIRVVSENTKDGTSYTSSN
ncbi:MAG: hypothetical protein QM770_21350 [Tepidisphaeraceae bacterium]